MTTTADSRLAALAARRHGVVTPEAAESCGVPRRTFYRRVGDGLYERLHRGVYRSVAVPITARTGALAAVEAVGGGAHLSGVSALACWGIGERPLVAPFHVITPHRCQRQLHGVIVHRGLVRRGDTTTHGGIPITMVPVSIVGAAGELALDELEDVVVESYRLGRCSDGDLRAVLGRLPSNTPGRADVRRVLRNFDPDACGRLMSRFETRGLLLVKRLGLPEPAVNRRLRGADGRLIGRLDFTWEPPGVVLEWDGLRFHSSRRDKESDDARQNELVLSGRLVLRYSWRDLDRPARIGRDILRAFSVAEARSGRLR